MNVSHDLKPGQQCACVLVPDRKVAKRSLPSSGTALFPGPEKEVEMIRRQTTCKCARFTIDSIASSRFNQKSVQNHEVKIIRCLREVLANVNNQRVLVHGASARHHSRPTFGARQYPRSTDSRAKESLEPFFHSTLLGRPESLPSRKMRYHWL